MPDIPSPLTSGKIVGNFNILSADSDDAGSEPDLLPVQGTATVALHVSPVQVLGDTYTTISVNTPINCTIVDGVLTGPDGEPGVIVIASDSPGISPSPIQWDVRVNIVGANPQPAPITVTVPTGETVDLATIVPNSYVGSVVTVVSHEDAVAAQEAAQQAQEALNEIISRGYINAVFNPDDISDLPDGTFIIRT